MAYVTKMPEMELMSGIEGMAKLSEMAGIAKMARRKK